MSLQPFLFAEDAWLLTRDGNETALDIFLRHYTARQRRKIRQFVGPGQKMVLVTPDARGLFVWRKFIDDCIDTRTGERQQGVNCAVFRNEGAGLSSALIDIAVQRAWIRWPFERLYTYVDARKIQSANPGYCFKRAGFQLCGTTKDGKLILERLACGRTRVSTTGFQALQARELCNVFWGR